MKTFKKTLCTLLVVVMCLTAAPLQGFADMDWCELLDINFGELFNIKASAASYSGYCGNNTRWYYNTSTKTLTISGIGPMNDYSWSYLEVNRIPWWDHKNDIKNIIIEPGVTTIGNAAFLAYSSLESLVISNTVTYIGDNNFGNLYLDTLIIPDSVIEIGNNVFENCYIQESVIIGKGLQKIGENFLTKSMVGMFEVSDENQYFSSAEGVLFNKEKTQLIKYPAYDERTIYFIPDSVVNISDEAFIYAQYLKEIVIPSTTNNIGSSVFYYCLDLEKITVSSTNNFYCSVDDVLYNKTKTNLIQYPAKKINSSYSIPTTVKSISDYAFHYAENLTDITISDNVESIGKEAFLYSGYYRDASNWEDNVLYLGCYLIASKEIQLTDYSIRNGTKIIADNALSIQNTVENYIIPNTVKIIGKSAFSWSSFTSITIPESVTTIEDYAFDACQEMTKITIPKSVISIGNGVFDSCFSLNKIIVNYLNPNYSSDSYGVLFNKNKTTLLRYPHYNNYTSYIVPSTVVRIEDYAFSGISGAKKSITIPNSVTEIGDYAFYSSYISSVVLPDNIRTIGKGAFSNCSALVNIVLPSKLSKIEESTFIYNTSLENITIPYSVTEIDEKAFLYCANLKTVNYSGTKEEWTKIDIKELNQWLTRATKVFHEHTKIGEAVLINPNCDNPGIMTSECSTCNRVVITEIPSFNHQTKEVLDKSLYIESSHNYSNSLNQTKTFTYPTADSLEITFSEETEVEEDYDRIYITDANGKSLGSYTGKTLSNKSITIPGNTFNIRLKSDDSVTKYGYSFSSIVAVKSAYSQWNVLTEPSCINAGCSERTCTLCAKKETKEIPMLGHTEKEIEGILPTCIIDGHASGVICSVCDAVISGLETIPAIGHDLVFNENESYPATCKKEGYTLYNCSQCDYVEEKYTTMINHTYTSEVTKEATHLAEGETTYTCACGDSYTEAIAKLEDHTYTSEVTKEATHLEEGETTYTCACGDSYTEAIAKLEDHTYEKAVTAPTCTEKGYTTYTCKCGDSYVGDYTEKLDHEYTSEITTPATHLTEGVKTFTCKCGDSHTEAIAKLEGHTYTSEVTKEPTHLEEGEMTFTCECGDSYTEVIEKIAKHNYKEDVTEPTCTAKGYTTYTCECGDIYVADYTEAKGHIYSVTTTQPTCTQNGLVTTFCTSCGDTHTETLEPTGHSFAEGSSKCENCDFDKADDCSCNCHKGGISGLIFKIILFFQRIFKTNKTCACGIAHY